MINIDWLYATRAREGVEGWDDNDWHSFSTYICYGWRILAKIYDLTDDDVDWRIIFINQDWHWKKYTVYWYYNRDTIQWFILWILAKNGLD